MKSTVTVKNLMVPALLLSLLTISSAQAAVSFDSFKNPVTHGKVIKHFGVMPILQRLACSTTDNKELVNQGPLVLSLHDVVKLCVACGVNYVWANHTDGKSTGVLEVVKHTALGEALYKALVTAGRAVGVNQKLSPEERARVNIFVAPFLKAVFADMVHDAYCNS